MKQCEKQNRKTIENLTVTEKNEVKLTLKNYVFENGFFLKSVVIIILFLGNVTFTFAQFDWGVKLGVNASTRSEIGNICDDNALKSGLNAGFVARYNFNDWMAVKSGFDYQGKGEKCDLKDENTMQTTKLNYIVLPLKAEFSASEKAGFKNGQRLFFATGPYFGYLLNAKQTKNDKTIDLEDLNDFDFGWSFELGFEFPVFKSNALQFSLNYDMGISDVADGSDVQNKSASVNLGFLF